MSKSMTNGELQHSINETWQRVGRDSEGMMVDHLSTLLAEQRRRARSDGKDAVEEVKSP